MLYKCVQSIVRKHQTNTEKINSYKSDLVDLFRSLGLAPFENTPCQRSDEEHSRVFQISLDEVYLGYLNFNCIILSSYPMYFVNQLMLDTSVPWQLRSRCVPPPHKTTCDTPAIPRLR